VGIDMFQKLKLHAAVVRGSMDATQFAIQAEIIDLKKKARGLYESYKNGTADLDCGKEMAETIRPHLYTVAQPFNSAWARLEEIDPTCPKGKRL
jgi:hypothetical protein